MNKYLLQKYIPFSILFITILTIQPYTTLELIGSTAVIWFLEFILLLAFYLIIPYLKTKEDLTLARKLVVLYLIYNFFSFFRGLFVAEIYWDYKALFNNGFALMLPMVFFGAMNANFVMILLKFYLKYTLPLFLLFFPFISSGAVGFYLVPISFLTLFLPIIKKPWNFRILIISLFVVFFALDARSNVIKFLVPILLSLLYYSKHIIKKNFLNMLRNILFILPFVLFSLGVSGTFNIFKMDEYLGVEAKTESTNVFTGEKKIEDLAADTRTGLYIEVLATANKYNTWVFGRTPARGNETDLFNELAEVTGRQERSGNEVAILNIFTWTGLVGVFFYFVCFYYASHLAINRSNNYFSKILGIYLAFRWCYAWVEDINYFTLTTFMLWITVGITASGQMRKMNNQQVVFWINSFFYKKIYYKYITYLKQKGH